MSELRGLLVDYGGVLTNPLTETVGDWLRADGIDPSRFTDLMRRWLATGAERNAVHDLETGRISTADFERLLAAELAGPDGVVPAHKGILTRMFAGFRPDVGMLDVVRKTRAAGIRTGLLSNSWGFDYPREGWDALFDIVVISGEVGLRKPDPEIYALAADRLGLPPEAIVFVDDLGPNVGAATEAGMVGVRHSALEQTVEELERLFGLALR
ncbi:MAG TPA: HAD family phosphatase [Mycobacteriales bacterium]|nr:HAD family phosphatase [Mycobacteriales bacterium]